MPELFVDRVARWPARLARLTTPAAAVAIPPPLPDDHALSPDDHGATLPPIAALPAASTATGSGSTVPAVPAPASRSLPLSRAATVAILLAVAAALLTLRPLGSDWPSPAMLALWLGLFTAAERSALPAPRGSRLGIAPAVDVAVILLAGPLVAVWLALLAAALGQAIDRGRAAPQALLDAGCHGLAILAAATAYHLAGGAMLGGSVLPPWPALLAAVAALAVAHWLVSTGLASLVRAAQGRRPLAHVWRIDHAPTVPHHAVMVLLGVAAAAAQLTWGSFASITALVPLVVVHGAIRSRLSEREQQIGISACLIDLLGEIDPYTSRHSVRVAIYSETLARAMGWSEPRVERVRLAALLHDVGKIAQERRVLTKPARLSDYERLCMQSHAGTGARVLRHVPALRSIADIIECHHERPDGRGYPAGKQGEEVPAEARLVLVADAFDAMTSSRTYRPGMPVARALAELERHQGRQFDREIVGLLRALVERGDLQVLRGSLRPRELERAG
ncbi:MAG: HD domain-containing protein [Candidatus Eiseniibacteriota bacterium]|jgi:putative nucleotidyltransferase with HDIG domain